MNKLKELWDKLPEKHKVKAYLIAFLIVYGLLGTADWMNRYGGV
jgi:hypothetical protein